MTSKKWLSAAALLSAALVSAPVLSQPDTGFAALHDLGAQALTDQEMDAVSGELNAGNILSALQSVSTKLSALTQQNPKLAPLSNAAQKAVDNFNSNAVNQLLMKLHVYTPY
jgi:aminoglycoside/choline kinase family phosphotransferase